MSHLHPFRSKQVRRAILETLSMAGDYALHTTVLVQHVDDLLRPPLQGSEFLDELRLLLTSEHIALVPEPLDPCLKQYVLTARGRSLLASSL